MPEKPRDQQAPVSFRSLEVEAALAERLGTGSPYGSMGAIAKRDLERYYYMLAQTLRSVSLTEQEALLLCDANNGIWWEPRTLSLLWAGVADAIRFDGLAEKWGVDGPALIEKLRDLTLCQTAAIVDASERWWRRVGEGIEEDRIDGLKAVGLIPESLCKQEDRANDRPF